MIRNLKIIISNSDPRPIYEQITAQVKNLIISGELKPGMVCDVRIEIADNAKRLLLPYLCVSKDNENQQYVYLIDKKTNTAQKRIVTTGNYYDKYLEITSGLNEGDLVVKNGKEKLTNNCLISL